MVRAEPPAAHAAGTRTIRVLAAGLALIWAALGVLFLAGLTASPVHLPMAAVAFVPAVVALVAVRRPRRSGVQSGPHLLLGVISLLVSLPTVLLLAEPLLAPDRAPRAVSLEIGYAGVVSFGLSLWFAVSLLVPRRPALLVSGTATAAAGLAALVAALGGTPATVPSGCAVPQLADASELTLVARAEIDGRPIGRVELRAERSGRREQWTATLSGTSGEGAVTGPDEEGQTLEGHVVDLLAGRSLLPAENLGLERLQGEPARHCRLMVDGEMATDAFPPLAWLAGGEPGTGTAAADTPNLDVWRGELDWWLGSGGRLLRADVLVGGHPMDAWGGRGLRGLLTAELSVAGAIVSVGAHDALP